MGKFRYQHIMSAVEGKLPTAEQLKDGEIAVNVFAGSEHIAMKNSNSEIVVFDTAAQVDSKLAEKEAEITKLVNDVYSLTKIVGDLGGAVTYELPNAAGKSFNTLMNNNGTVKLTEDVTTGRFGPGMMANNTVKLNLNSHNLTFSGLTVDSSFPAIAGRGSMTMTIGGKGTIDAGGGICVESMDTGVTINLTGSTTVYKSERPGGELIYAYKGTINITNGTFRNSESNFTLNCYDANYKAGTANIVVTSSSKTSGPHFLDFDPGNNKAEGEGTNFVGEGCESVSSGTITAEMVGTKTYGYTITEEDVDHVIYTVIKSA